MLRGSLLTRRAVAASAALGLGLGARYIHSESSSSSSSSSSQPDEPGNRRRAIQSRSSHERISYQTPVARQVSTILPDGTISDEPVFVGIAGGTGSGKTTVAAAIAERLGPSNLVHISHDSYYRDLGHMPPEERKRVNFDHPDSLESSLLVEHLKALRRGECVAVPTYDFATNTRLADTVERVEPAPIILVEGILIYSNEELRDLLDVKLFVDTEGDIRFIRR